MSDKAVDTLIYTLKLFNQNTNEFMIYRLYREPVFNKQCNIK